MTKLSGPQHSTGKKIALAVTGGIAAYKAIEVLRGFQRAGCEVRVAMTRHACEQRNIEKLRHDGVRIIQPDEGEMACRAIGPGRLSEPELIVNLALEILKQDKTTLHRSANEDSALDDLRDEQILITAGATREPIDPVRFISNRSSGRMGFALAEAALSRGAQVTVIAGVTTVTPRAPLNLVRVNSAAEMHEAVARAAHSATIFIGAAAVSDYRPEAMSATKIKKSRANLELKLERTEDILAEVSRGRRNGQLIIGFAAETDNAIENAREKLRTKDLDAIVVNDVSQAGIGFDSENNAAVILVRDNPKPIELPLMSKLNAAHRILDEVVKLRRSRSAKTALQRN